MRKAKKDNKSNVTTIQEIKEIGNFLNKIKYQYNDLGNKILKLQNRKNNLEWDNCKHDFETNFNTYDKNYECKICGFII